MLIRDAYLDEDTSLILSSTEEVLRKSWSTKELRKYGNGEKEPLKLLLKELSNLGLFQYASQLKGRALVEMNILVGSRLLPGVISSSVAALPALDEKEINEILSEPLVTVSDSPLVPAASEADYIVIGDLLGRKDRADISVMDSIDDSMPICKVELNGARRIGVNRAKLAIAIASQMIGHGEEALRMAVDYSRGRIAFGKPIGSFQAIKHKLVDDAVSVEMVKSATIKASMEPKLAEVALSLAVQRIPKVIMDSIQVHGGIGFTEDLDLHLHLKRSLTLSKVLRPNVREDLFNF
jgi:Acyl-CoA dehydrogenases